MGQFYLLQTFETTFNTAERIQVSVFFFFLKYLYSAFIKDETGWAAQLQWVISKGGGGHYGHSLGGCSLCPQPQGIRSSSIRCEEKMTPAILQSLA